MVGPIIISLVVGSAFYNTGDNTNGFFSQQGVIFFSLLFNSIQVLVEISTQFAQRPIGEKQKGFGMYHTGMDAISSLISIFPVKLVGMSFFNIVLYNLSGLRREAGPFFIYMLFTFTVVLTITSFFRQLQIVDYILTCDTSSNGACFLIVILH